MSIDESDLVKGFVHEGSHFREALHEPVLKVEERLPSRILVRVSIVVVRLSRDLLRSKTSCW
jgi:hypothetical protein